jgi:hypothetical protein
LYPKSPIRKQKATFVIEMQFDFFVFLKYHDENGHAKWRSTPSRFFCNRRIHPCSRYGHGCWRRIFIVLSFEKSGLQQDILGGNWGASYFLQNLFSVVKAERFVGTTIVQLFPFVGIDVVHHSRDFFLAQVIEAYPFGNHSSNQSMINLNRSFLVRASGITVVNLRTEIVVTLGTILDSLRVGKLTAIVCQNDREQLSKQFSSQRLVKAIEYINH